MASQTTAVQTEIPTTVRLSEYRKEEKRGVVAIAGVGRKMGESEGKCEKVLWRFGIGSKGETGLNLNDVVSNKNINFDQLLSNLFFVIDIGRCQSQLGERAIQIGD